MKLTKYEHSCLDIELDGQRLLIDPGTVTTSIPNYQDIIAVVVTHVHPDHLDPEKLKAIHAQNPQAPLYTVQAVADELKGSLPCVVVTGGESAQAGPFKLEFAGGQHATIHSSYPPTDNVGVTVNGKLYYPGDSLSPPNRPVATLAAPIAAPWLKSSEVMDFIASQHPQRVFQFHDGLLSDFGLAVFGARLQDACTQAGIEYSQLKPGQSLTL